MMSPANEKPKIIAVCQITATNNKDDNFQTCKSLIESAKAQNAIMAFLPEACDYIGESKAETLALSEPLNGCLVEKYCDLARTLRIWLSLGGIHEQVNSEKVQNAHLLIDDEGNIRATYRKTHLFNVNLPEKGIRLMESDYVIPGKEIVPPVSTPVGCVGLSICYDMRFPELSLMLSKMGADILTFPSAFTYATGAAHWETLLKARAIESQCYVVAAAQTGSHNKKRTSWGHAMIVDPWGTIIAQCREGTGLAVAEIDLGYVQQIRKSMPVWTHRRNDLYPELEPKDKFQVECNEKSRYQFGEVFIDASAVFYRTKSSIAFTNKKCVLPGHVLVIPVRPARRLLDLKQDELCDLFQVVQKVQYVMETVHGTASSTITVQDGEAAGQTIKVQCSDSWGSKGSSHLLPRRSSKRVLVRSNEGQQDLHFERNIITHPPGVHRPWRLKSGPEDWRACVWAVPDHRGQPSGSTGSLLLLLLLLCIQSQFLIS